MEPALSLRTVNLGVTVARNFSAFTRPHLCLPACLPAAPFGASARQRTARLDGLTDRAKGPPIGFPNSSDLRSYHRAVDGSFWKAHIPMSYDVAPAMRRLNTVHARLSSSNFKMLPFDIRRPSRDAQYSCISGFGWNLLSPFQRFALNEPQFSMPVAQRQEKPL
jgi:hypothetical protein